MPEFDYPFRPVIIEKKEACRSSETNAELLGILLGLLKQLRLSLEVITPNNANDFQNSLKKHPDEVVITWLTYVSLVFDLLVLENMGMPFELLNRMRDFIFLTTSKNGPIKPHGTEYQVFRSSSVRRIGIESDPRQFVFPADEIIKEILKHFGQDVRYFVDRARELKSLEQAHDKAVAEAQAKAVAKSRVKKSRAKAEAKSRVPA